MNDQLANLSETGNRSALELTEDVADRLKTDIERLANNGVHLINDLECVTGYSYKEFYDWDLYFECLALSYFGVSEFARNGIDIFLAKQRPDGYVPRTQEFVWVREGQQFKPFLCQLALLYLRQSDDSDWVGSVFDKLTRNFEYWFSDEYDASKSGLPVWNSADHTGMDNVDERAGAVNSYVCQAVDLAVYLVRESQALAQMAMELKRTSDAEKYHAKANELKDKIQTHFWCEEDGFFYDRNIRTGDFIKVKTVAGFAPLWVNAATKEQADIIVKQHLLNPNEFWLEYPVASMSKLEPGFRQQPYDYEECCNWKGPTWMPTNYFVFQGLRQYGYLDEAKILAEKTIKMLLKNENTREYYNSETGEGIGLNPFFGWSILGYFMSIELENDYSPADIELTEVRTVAGWQDFAHLFEHPYTARKRK